MNWSIEATPLLSTLLVSAARALIAMTAKRLSPAAPDGIEHLHLRPR